MSQYEDDPAGSPPTQARAAVTRALDAAAAGGGRGAIDAVLPLIYDELRALAGRHLRGERAGHTLQATALVNEAYLRLAGERNLRHAGCGQLFGAAASAIRRILVDHARSAGRGKRGGGRGRVALSGVDLPDGRTGAVDLVALDDALERLGRLSGRAAQVVELRYFAGLTADEAAAVLGVSSRTVADDWALARAWLRRELADADDPGDTADAVGGGRGLR